MARSVIVCGSFDLARYGSIRLDYTDDVSGAQFQTLSSGKYDHDGLCTEAGITTIGDLAAAVQAMLYAADGVDYVVTFDRSTGKYTIAAPVGISSFSINWTGAAGLRLRRLLGFVADCTGALSYTSTHVPWLCMKPRIAGVADYIPPFAEKGQISTARSSAGTPFRTGPITLKRLTSWTHQYEPKSAIDETYRASLGDANVSHLYSWEQLWEDFGRDCRMPIAMEMVGALDQREVVAFDLATPEYDDTTHRRAAKSDDVRFGVMISALLCQQTADVTKPARALFEPGGGGGVAPTNTVAPVASGTVTIGGSLSCTDGTWTGDPTIVFTYQWQRGNAIDGVGTYSNIGGATANAYTVVAADIGYSVRCVVTGTNGSGAASANSNARLFNITTYFGANEKLLLDERATRTGATWTDQTGSGNTFAQASGSLQPGVGTAINGQPTLSFDGTDDVMVSAGALSAIISSTAFGLWLVPRTGAGLAAPSGSSWLDRQILGDANGYFGITSNTSPRLWIFDGAYKETTVGGLTLAASTVCALRAVKDGSGIRLKATGQTETTSVAAGAIGNVAGAMWMGRSFGTGYGQFQLAFLLAINRAPTSGEQADVSAYTANKYGVAS